MSDRDIAVASLLLLVAALMGILDAFTHLADQAEGGVTFVKVASVGWAGYRLSR